MVLRLLGGMFHKTSARADFEELLPEPSPESPLITVNLILPNGNCHPMQVHNDYFAQKRLKRNAWLLLNDGAGSGTRKRKATGKEDNGADNVDQ